MRFIIVGYDRNRAIGAGGDMPWGHGMKSDLRRVRELTTGNAVIMGRTTYDSIGHPLPNRQNIVLSRQPLSIEGVTVAHSIEEAYAAVEQGRDTYVFGGAQVYALAIDTVDEILATEIDESFDHADTFFPELRSKWHEVGREAHEADADNAYPYAYVTYARV